MSGWSPKPLLNASEILAYRLAHWYAGIFDSLYLDTVDTWYCDIRSYVDRRLNETFRR